MNNNPERIRETINNLRDEVAIKEVNNLFDVLLRDGYDIFKGLISIENAVDGLCDEIMNASGIDEAIKLRAAEVGARVKRHILYIGEKVGNMTENIPIDFPPLPNDSDSFQEATIDA